MRQRRNRIHNRNLGGDPRHMKPLLIILAIILACFGLAYLLEKKLLDS
jgi:hypothetical protein